MIQTSLIVFALIFGIYNSTSKSKYVFIFLSVLIWLIASIRYAQGPDYFAYALAYYRLDINPLEEFSKPLILEHEILFRILGSTIKSFGFSYQLYLATIAAISIFFISRLSWKYSPYPILSLLLFYSAFYFTWPYSGLRQGLTLCIGSYYLIDCIKNNQPIKYLIIAIFLSLIHLSAALSIIFYFACKLTFEIRVQTFLAISGLIISLFLQQIIENIIYIVPFAERVLFYEEGFNSSSFLDFKTISRLFIFFVSIYIYNIFRKNNDALGMQISASLMISFLVYTTLKFSEILAAQISLYGFILLIIVFPRYLNIPEKLFKRDLKLVLFIFFSISYFTKTYTDMVISSEKNKYNESLLPLNYFSKYQKEDIYISKF